MATGTLSVVQVMGIMQSIQLESKNLRVCSLTYVNCVALGISKSPESSMCLHERSVTLVY